MKKNSLFVLMLLLLTGCSSKNITTSVTGEYSVPLDYTKNYHKKNVITIGEDTIPSGIYQVSVPSKITYARVAVNQPYDYDFKNVKDKVLNTSSKSIIQYIAEDSKLLSTNSNDYTVYLPEGYELSVNTKKLRDRGKKVTFKKVSSLPTINELPDGNGLSTVKEGTNSLKIEFSDENGIKRYKDSTTIFTFDANEYVEYKFSDEDYKITKYKIKNNFISPYVKETHYYNEEAKDENSITVKLLDNTFIRNDVY